MKNRPLIDGGKLDRRHLFPATVRLDIGDSEAYPDGEMWTCSGTLIAPQVVLTAAHCAEDTIASSHAKIHVNGPRQTDDEEGTTGVKSTILTEAKIAKIKAMKKKGAQLSDETAPDDLAILILDRPETLPSYPSLACGQPQSGTPVSIAGYGVVAQITKTGSGAAAKFAIDSKNEDVLSARYYGSNHLVCRPDRVPDDFLEIQSTLSQLANASSQLTNHGDSGSGLMSPLGSIIYGVNSGLSPPEKDENGNFLDRPYVSQFSSVSSATGKALLEYAKKTFPVEMKSVKLCPAENAE
ncbi:MAG: trypsin-like serine protease [Methylotenera sp.]|nr:trypsin-like serine protease [Oligoflexia bacterium]